MQSLTPFIATWQKAIVAKDIEAARKADEKYEAKWQGLEMYVNHRSLPLYRDREVNTQFAMETELRKEQPD